MNQYDVALAAQRRIYFAALGADPEVPDSKACDQAEKHVDPGHEAAWCGWAEIADDGPDELDRADDLEEDWKADRAADEYERNFWRD